MNALQSNIRPFCHNGRISICHQAFQSVEHSCTDVVTPGEVAVMDQPDVGLGTVQCEWSALVNGEKGQVVARCEPGSSVGIATDYALDGPGSNPGADEIFRPSRPVLGPTQPPVKWVPGLSRG